MNSVTTSKRGKSSSRQGNKHRENIADDSSDTEAETYTYQSEYSSIDDNKLLTEILTRTLEETTECIDTQSLLSQSVAVRPLASAQPLASRYGVFTLHSIPSRSPICELRGEIISQEEYKETPMNQYALIGVPKPFVFFESTNNLCVDARRFGNDARFVRRSCDPNASIELVRFKSDKMPHFIIVSSRSVKSGNEITLPWDFDLNHPAHTIKSAKDEPLDFNDEERAHLSEICNAIMTHAECSCTDTSTCLFARMKRLSKPTADSAGSPNSTSSAQSKRRKISSADPEPEFASGVKPEDIDSKISSREERKIREMIARFERMEEQEKAKQRKGRVGKRSSSEGLEESESPKAVSSEVLQVPATVQAKKGRQPSRVQRQKQAKSTQNGNIRVQKTALLRTSQDSTLLLSPRRFAKTSLLTLNEGLIGLKRKWLAEFRKRMTKANANQEHSPNWRQPKEKLETSEKNDSIIHENSTESLNDPVNKESKTDEEAVSVSMETDDSLFQNHAIRTGRDEQKVRDTVNQTGILEQTVELEEMKIEMARRASLERDTRDVWRVDSEDVAQNAEDFRMPISKSYSTGSAVEPFSVYKSNSHAFSSIDQVSDQSQPAFTSDQRLTPRPAQLQTTNLSRGASIITPTSSGPSAGLLSTPLPQSPQSQLQLQPQPQPQQLPRAPMKSESPKSQVKKMSLSEYRKVRASHTTQHDGPDNETKKESPSVSVVASQDHWKNVREDGDNGTTSGPLLSAKGTA